MFLERRCVLWTEGKGAQDRGEATQISLVKSPQKMQSSRGPNK